jgi:hypothetical protein
VDERVRQLESEVKSLKHHLGAMTSIANIGQMLLEDERVSKQRAEMLLQHAWNLLDQYEA